MSTIESINDILSTQSATHGWDALVVYNRDRINTLLHQQYIAKVNAGENYLPFSHETVTTAAGYNFKSLVLGPPLISFENSNIQDSRVNVRMMFTDGSFIQTDSDGNVVQWERYTPASQYGLNISVELKYGNGKVSENGKITLDFSEGLIYKIEGINGLPADITQAFQDLLKNTAVSYDLGELKHEDPQQKLYPVEFVVRTQKYPGSNALASTTNTDGAVLVFIETEYGGKGTLPSDNDSQPWVLPDNKTATLLISDKLLYGPLLAESFEDRIKDFTWEASETDGEYSLNFTSGYVPTTNVITQRYAGLGFHGWLTSTDNAQQPRPARLSMTGFQIKKGDDGKSVIGAFADTVFTDTFTDTASVVDSGTYIQVENIEFSRDGQFKATLQLDSNSNIIFSGNADFEVTSSNNHWGAFVGEDASVQFASEATSNLNQDGLFELNDIKTFYLRSILFPDDNILSFSEVYNPGDLALYGDIAQSLTALTITPDETIIACGQSLQFSASLSDGSTPQGIVWSVDGVGSIDGNGLYTAPATGQITQNKNVIVTATTSEGLKSIALATVLVSALDVEPAFVMVKESDASAIQFTAYQVGATEQEVTWTIESDMSSTGSVDSEGLYTPPASGEFDTDEPVIINVVASLPSGETVRAVVCLWGEQIELGFPVTPPYMTGVSEGAICTFSTQNRHFDAESWTNYPALGTMSEPEEQASEDKMHIWSCDYQAPAAITGQQLVFIKVTQDEPDAEAGYALVELQPSTSPWSRVTTISTLSITTVDAVTSSTEIYGNGLNQATMLVTINAQDENYEDVTLTTEDLLPYIKLIDYNTGEDISVTNVWTYSDKINDYNTQPSVRAGTMIVPLYVTANQGDLVKDIAVEVQLINPSASYEYYSTAKNSNTGMDSKVTIVTYQPINYSDKSNISYGSNDPVKIKDNLLFTIISEDDSNENKHTGECYECLVEITPSTQLDTEFKTVSIDYLPVLNETVNTDTQSWADVVDDPSFSCLVSDVVDSCSVAGYHVIEGDVADPALESSAMIFFEATQFEGGESPGLNGNIYFEGGDKKYRVIVQDIPEYSSSSNNVAFVGYMIKLPVSGLQQLGWKSSLNEVTVNVIDQYGNSGQFALRWDDFQNYVTPSVI